MRKNIDFWMLGSIIGLVIFSLFNIFGIKPDLVGNQFIFFVVGFILFFLFFRISIHFFRLNARIFYITFLVLLASTFVIGSTIRGSRRWIDLYFFQFQTSEFFKVFFLLYLADTISRAKKIDTMMYAKSFLLFVVPFLIIFKQPDLGSALIFSGVYIGILFLIGFSIRYFIYATLGFAALFPILWHFLKEYQKVRLSSFINPDVHEQGLAYNLIQSIITVGSGRLFGRGLGLGTQSRFQFLPENHTDFAFASLVEQFGFIGGSIVILLYAIIIYRLIHKAFMERSNRFNFMFLIGTALFLTVAVVINIGMNVGLLPVAGIALPLISYGGSSIVSTLLMLGLALAI